MTKKTNHVRDRILFIFLCRAIIVTILLVILFLICVKMGFLSYFQILLSKVGFFLGQRALSFFLIKMGCAGGLSFAIVFIGKVILADATEAMYMMAPSGSAPVSSGSLSQTHPVLEGRPVPEGTPVPKAEEWDAVSSPFYCSSVVHIPGEIEDPLTLSKLSKLNGVLLYLEKHIFGVMEPGYTQAIQRELDQTAADSLPAKLDSIIRRESARFRI